jgi:4-amino-4-deoxy-L-arabinose transferase-like glycosyltransferase
MSKIKSFFTDLSLEKVTLICLLVISCISAYYSLTHNYILAYNDATAHLNTARRVIDNLTPGLVQLGSVWLPLLHIFQIPFVSNYYLWQSGLAGWVVSGISFIIAALFIFKLVDELTNDKWSAFIAVLVMTLNTNMLYLQTTAMFEPLLMAAASGAIYFLTKWGRENRINYLLLGALFTCLASLTRYDGWALFVGAALYTVFIAIIRRIKHFEGILFLFLSLAGLGIFLWFLYNLAIFGNPLYFQNGEFSAKAQQDVLFARGSLPTKGNLLLSAETYSVATVLNNGVIPTILSFFGLIYFLIKNITKPKNFGPFLLILTYFFNIFSLYSGQSVIWIPFLPPYFETYFNIRYGLLMLPAIAFFIAYLTRKNIIIKVIVIVLLFVQMFLFVYPKYLPIFGHRIGTVTLLDTVSSVNTQTKNASTFLRTHYDKGLIMASSASIDAFIFRTGIPLKNYITEGTGQYWKTSLQDPRKYATWLVFFRDTTDRVGKVLTKWKDLDKYYDLVYKDQTYLIWKIKKK